MNSRLRIALIVCVVILAGVTGSRLLFGSSSFDPEAVAEAETRMWQAYYTRDKMALGMELIAMLRSQYGVSMLEAKAIGERLAKASMTFGRSRGDYEKRVLPDLIDAYTRIRDATGRQFDPETAARAELAWWVARRTPGDDSVEQVGDKIAALYAVLYGGDHPAFRDAGRLRAEAAHLRDTGGADADWDAVERLLVQSYRNLASVM